jgi:phosphoenolpyruvate carboxykinase (ATP)
MNEFGLKAKNTSLADIGLKHVEDAYWNLSPAELVEETIIRGEGTLTDTGALAVDTGKFTGRSPKDKFLVTDDITAGSVWWGDINIKFSSEDFDNLYNRVAAYLTGRTVYVRDAYACADKNYRLNLRVITEFPWQNLFASNLFLRPSKEEILRAAWDWKIIAAPGFQAEPETDGTGNRILQ